MQGFALTQEQIIEVLSVYATAEQYIEGVTATATWAAPVSFNGVAYAPTGVTGVGHLGAASVRFKAHDFGAGPVWVPSGDGAVLA